MTTYFPAFAEEEIVEEVSEELDVRSAEDISADALDNYDVEGSLFEKITTLEQEKVVMQLEKERAQLDLDIDRLNAERLKFQATLEKLMGPSEEEKRGLEEAEAIKEELEAQVEQLRKQVEALQDKKESGPQKIVVKGETKEEPGSINTQYKLINVIGVGNQLIATVENIATGQNKRISVGKQLDGYTIKSISLNDGIVFEKDGVSENLSIGK